MSRAFKICMVMYFCEAWEVNKLTVLAVGPNGHKDDDDDKDKIASSGSDPPKGSDKKKLEQGHYPTMPSVPFHPQPTFPPFLSVNLTISPKFPFYHPDSL